MNDRNRGCGTPLLWVLALTLLLGWVPVAGPLLAGFVGGRKARLPHLAFLAALVPAALLGGGLWWLSHLELKVGGSQLVAGPLMFLGVVNAAALLGGALLGARGGVARVLGLAVVAAGLAWFFPHARDVYNLAVQLQPEAAPPAAADGSCPENLRRLYTATLMYSADWDDTLPPASAWMSKLSDPVQPRAQEEWLHCPAVSRPGTDEYGYAMNAGLDAAPLAGVSDRGGTALFYDSTDLKRDANDEVATLPEPGRHAGKNFVVNADGAVPEQPEPAEQAEQQEP